MCGITGIISFRSVDYSIVLERMTNTLKHRGPDSSGFLNWYTEINYIGFGHRRLSIIDLSPAGYQPMITVDKNYAIILNGEIYNYREIRKELEYLGHKFHSNSDTEVVLLAFVQWSVKSVDKFIGMFSFALYDIKENLIYLFRDRAGVKPLYYYSTENIFLFASEIKSFHNHPEFEKNIDQNSLADFLKHSWIPAPHTIYKNCYKVKPGHYIRIDLARNTFREIEYWNSLDFFNKGPVNTSESELLEQVEALLTSAFKYRMVADVPVGVFLSGGYDSSLVAAILQKDSSRQINTFTIGFDDNRFNEASFARKVAKHLGTNHHEMYCNYKQALELIPMLPEYYDEPFADSSAIPTMLVSRMTSEKVKVALSADGGDELFGGYPWYNEGIKRYTQLAKIGGIKAKFISYIVGILNNPVTRTNLPPLFIQKLLKFDSLLKTNEYNTKFRYKLEPYHLKEYEIKNLMLHETHKLSSNFDEFKFLKNSSDPINMLMAIDFKTIMVDDYLVKVDRASMAFSLECREPFLDHRLIEFMARVPSSLKIKNGINKYLLKKITHNYIPATLMDRPKMGFAIPKRKWLQNELKSVVIDTLSSTSTGDFFSTKYIFEFLHSFYTTDQIDETKLWNLFMFQLWYSKWK